MPRKKGPAMWSGAERLNNTKPKRRPVGVGTWRMLVALRRNICGVNVLGGTIRIYFFIQGFKKNSTKNLPFKTTI